MPTSIQTPAREATALERRREPDADASAGAGTAAERLLAAVFTVVEHGIVVLDDEGRFVTVNPGYTALLGWQTEQVLERDFTEFLAPEDREDASSRHRQAMATRLGYRRVDRCLTADGRVMRLESSSAIVEQPDGRPVRVAALTPVDLLPGPGEHRVMIAGRLQLIGLAEIRVALGDRWPALSERAFSIAESLLRARLAPTDVFARTEKGFVICFASLSEDEARFKAAALADEVQRRLLGELAPADAAQTLSFVGRIELTWEEDGPLQSIAATVDAKLQAIRQASERRLHELLERAAETGSLALEPVYNRAGQRAPLGIGRFRDGLDGELERLAHTLAGDTALALEMNLLVLNAAGHRLADAPTAGGDGDAPMCLVPVDFGVLLNRKLAAKYVEACRALSAVARERLLFELRRAPPETAPLRVEEAVQLLSPFARGVAVELPDPANLFVDFKRRRVPIVTLRSAALVRGGGLRGDAGKTLRNLRQHRVRVLAKEIASERHLSELRKAEIDLYAGPALTAAAAPASAAGG